MYYFWLGKDAEEFHDEVDRRTPGWLKEYLSEHAPRITNWTEWNRQMDNARGSRP